MVFPLLIALIVFLYRVTFSKHIEVLHSFSLFLSFHLIVLKKNLVLNLPSSEPQKASVRVCVCVFVRPLAAVCTTGRLCSPCWRRSDTNAASLNPSSPCSCTFGAETYRYLHYFGCLMCVACCYVVSNGLLDVSLLRCECMRKMLT